MNLGSRLVSVKLFTIWVCLQVYNAMLGEKNALFVQQHETSSSSSVPGEETSSYASPGSMFIIPPVCELTVYTLRTAHDALILHSRFICAVLKFWFDKHLTNHALSAFLYVYAI